jgi:hypothetical protein
MKGDCFLYRRKWKDFLRRPFCYDISPMRATPTLPILHGDVSALCKESTALHSIPPHSLDTYLFCSPRIILWPVLFVCKVSCFFVVSLCLHFLSASVCLSMPYYYVLCHIPPCACMSVFYSAGFLPYKAESRSKTLPGLCSFVRK